ncbi:NAD(P)/FAD-dependent oxidoreductase [Variovorax guangxiensis]|uniref:D-amino-acid dehydrogenase n=1 Tax=Variovorax guangxiensis TaxID=1775474 RepID=A0A840FWN9_9BURK|nr:FAD-dependent oxidoreductase [Variovorax guangxiensis]MBB4221108.1 D-amino-acid dehydrogenase [Variovorax guangxiensis]
MKIVVMCWLARASADVFVARNIVLRPDLAAKAPHQVAAELAALAPDVVIAREAQHEAVSAIAAGLPGCRFIFCGLSASRVAIDPSTLQGRCAFVTGSNWERAEYEAFVLAESMCRPRHGPSAEAVAGAPGEVMLVGAGVVNLVTALTLCRRGHRVSVYDRMADPRRGDTPHAERAGATFGGRDARIFSYNESRHHLACSPLYTPRDTPRFRLGISRDGWLSRDYQTMSDADRRWIDQLEQVPPWAALLYGNDIVGFNRQSHRLWRELFSLYPELLRETHHVGRLLRIYPSEASLRAAQTAEAEIGALISAVPLTRLREREPALGSAIDEGAIAGALDVQGFSLNIVSFCRNLIGLLERLGARFHWQHEASEVRHAGSGAVTGIVVNDALRRADHYVLSPGAQAHTLAARTAGLPAIGAMVGMWVTLPNDGTPLQTPLKVRRRAFGSSEAAQGANVVPGRDAAGRPVLHCSSGHGFVGASAEDVRLADLPELARCVMETAEELFGDKFRRARESGMLGERPGFCVRPWTPSGLGVLEVQEADAGGKMVLSGGHNTGGFAQSPAVAEAVACALEARPHAMHTLYHPRRFADVFEVTL